jgi:hypothetical protein
LEKKVALKITGFNLAGSGAADLNLKMWSDPDEPVPLYKETTTVSISPAAGPAIIDFDISEHRVLQGDPVTLTAHTANAKTVILYYDTDTEREPAEKIEPSKPGEIETKYVYSHKPQGTTKYRLKAWRDQAGGSKTELAEREITVQVDPRPHWYSRDLLVNSLRGTEMKQTFYPTLLLPAKDLSGIPGERLYGIFVDKKTKEAGLWSSSSGLDGWRWEADVPAGMGESPGVIHNQVLWLIGGSSADPLGAATNRVWWYFQRKGTSEMVWKEWDPEGTERKALTEAGRGPIPRNCHTCASFDGKVWVLGGLSAQDQELDDVWTCVANPREGDFTATWTPSQKLPTGRCMSAAAVTPAKSKIRGITEPRLWLFGGVTHPYNLNETKDEFLWTDDGKDWRKFPLPPTTPETKRAPLGATLLYSDDGHLHLAGVFGEKSIKNVLYKLMGADLTDRQWEETSISFGWDYDTLLFLIRSVPFRERWIFWPVYQDWTGKTQHNPRIYNTPKQQKQ